jgi:hypothetical protein
VADATGGWGGGDVGTASTGVEGGADAGGTGVGVAVGVADAVVVIVGELSAKEPLFGVGDTVLLTRVLLELLPARVMPQIAVGAKTVYRARTAAKAAAELELDNPGNHFQPAHERRLDRV